MLSTVEEKSGQAATPNIADVPVHRAATTAPSARARESHRYMVALGVSIAALASLIAFGILLPLP